MWDAFWKGEGLVVCLVMEDIFNLFSGMKLTLLKATIQISFGSKVLGCAMNSLDDPDDQRGEI